MITSVAVEVREYCPITGAHFTCRELLQVKHIEEATPNRMRDLEACAVRKLEAHMEDRKNKLPDNPVVDHKSSSTQDPTSSA